MLATAVERAFAEITSAPPPPATSGDDAELRGFGRLGAAEIATIRADAIESVIGPCFDALLSGDARRAA
jgi:hypothetical protein